MGHTPESRARAYDKMKQARKDWILLNGPCKTCGSSEKLEVDHVDPAEKEHHAVWSWAPSRREKELAKCQVLCKVCHRLKTSEFLSKLLKNRFTRKRKHGTANRYWHGPCRCDDCKAAYSLWRHEQYLRLGS